ncbi:hypothetical protein ACFO4E_17825 [Nocardiopsis mangrovi]|uniref:Uncharacterized protein n=1 Tax=Nocardiopsis mangrovi TaxID=1179818 RepID=A0ABV9DZI0_9ACTN
MTIDRLVAGDELLQMPSHAAPRGEAKLLLALLALLSTDPDGGEPIEDAHGGVVQSLAIARTF